MRAVGILAFTAAQGQESCPLWPQHIGASSENGQHGACQAARSTVSFVGGSSPDYIEWERKGVAVRRGPRVRR